MSLVIIDGPYGLEKYLGDEIRTPTSEALYRQVFQTSAFADSIVVFGNFISLAWIYETFLLDMPTHRLRREMIWHKPDSVGGSSRQFTLQHESFLYLATENAVFYEDAIRVPYGERAKSGVAKKGGKTVGWLPNPFGARRGSVVTFAGDRLVEKIGGRTGAAKHPCVKPKELLRMIVCGLTASGEAVYEPFVGSANLQNVCTQEDREYFGFTNALDFECKEGR